MATLPHQPLLLRRSLLEAGSLGWNSLSTLDVQEQVRAESVNTGTLCFINCIVSWQYSFLITDF